MNAVATIRQPTKLERFIGEVLPADQRDSFYSVLPRHIKPDRFERALANVLMNTPEMMSQDPKLIFREISKVVGLGLSLDPQFGEAYLILGWNAKTRQKEPQVRIGYKGMIKLAKQSGEILNIYAREVHERDEIECIQGDENRLIHKPRLFTDRGPVVGYYAVVKYKTGEIDFEPMSLDQIHAIRDRSDGWKAFKDGKIKSNPWETDEGEMSKKTVFRRLTKRVSQSADLNDAIAIEDRAEFSAFDKARNDTPPPATRRVEQTQPAAAHIIEHEPAEVAPVAGERQEQAAPTTDTDGVVTADELLTELDDRLGHASTAEEVEEGYTNFDAEALLSDYPHGVPRARKLKADHLDRVGAAGTVQQTAAPVDDSFPGDEAIERARAKTQAYPPDPWVIPEFKGGGHYQIWVRAACDAATTSEHEDRLRLLWSQTKPQRDDLAEQGQIDNVVVKLLLDDLKRAFDRIQAATQPNDDLPPPAPRRAAPAPQPAEKAPPPAEAPSPPAKPASDDPVAAYTARQEQALATCTTKQDVEKFWLGACDERDDSGATEGMRLTWKAAMQRRKADLPSAEG